MILNFAPLAPQLWGKSQLASKSPFRCAFQWASKSPLGRTAKLGDLGGLDVANGTSQTTSKVVVVLVNFLRV
ncbi:hypothetical protein BJP34_24525 [Moorena producens PAL-8-15-08-1]|uniref:Uncharacterized protein n=1 Tax=Moorena producens PAL-8-15-08-1 TaxID=1458985 RepID=A0A1D8TX80_9CYAN|nr:hypothetical protein BJP34_24525 [Moorena producens PAL-8-15-08-1]